MKRGHKLTHEMKEKICQMVIDGHTDKQIAIEMNCMEDTVTRNRKKLGIQKGSRGQITVDPKMALKNTMARTLSTKEEKEKSWEIALKASKRFARLNEQFDAKEIDFFIEQWIAYHMQLEDMTASEDDLLESLIIYNIRIAENQKKYKQTQKYEEVLMGLLKGRKEQELDLENENDRFIFEMMQSNNKAQQEINKELKDLREGFEKSHRMLSTTREQREQRNKIGADTFLHLVRMMQDRDRRKEIGRENELVKLAVKKKTKELKKVHTFSDGSQEALLLDGYDYKEKEKEDGKDGVNTGN